MQNEAHDPWHNHTMQNLVTQIRREHKFIDGGEKGRTKDCCQVHALPSPHICKGEISISAIDAHAAQWIDSLCSSGFTRTAGTTRRKFGGQPPWRGLQYDCEPRSRTDRVNEQLSDIRSAALGPPGPHREIAHKVTDGSSEALVERHLQRCHLVHGSSRMGPVTRGNG